MNARRLTLTALASLCALAGGLAFSAPALALTEHAFSGSFGGKGSEEGKFEEPEGVAVNNATHDVYVVDSHNNRVEEFTSAGVYIGQFDGSAAPTGALSAPRWIAVDNSGSALDPSKEDVYVTGEVKVAGEARNVVYKFSAAGVYEGQLSEGESGHRFSELYGVAVDPRGVVWVYQSSKEIDSFSDALANAFLSKREVPFGVTSPEFAVDSEDSLYTGRGGDVVVKLNSSGEELIGEVDNEASTGAAVDVSSNQVYIDNMGTVGAFSSTGAFIERFGSGHLTGGSGLAVDPSNHAVYAADAAADNVAIFDEVLLPDVGTGEATGVEVEGGATLHGTVDPDGVPVTSCEFEYFNEAALKEITGLDFRELLNAGVPLEEIFVGFGTHAECETSPGHGTEPVAVDAKLAGLTPGTLYHYRLLAGNASGSSPGVDRTFIALSRPKIEEESVSNVASASATLEAQVNPGGLETTYRFEYGPTASYGTSVPVPEGDAGSGISAVEVSVHPQDLKPGTTYHYRVVVSNALQREVAGPDQQFTTQPSGSEFVLPDDREWELVTPPDKYGAGIESIGFEPGATIEAAAGGGAIAYAMNGPITGSPAGNRAPEETEVLSRRGADGWESEDITTPDNEGRFRVDEDDEYRFFSPDLSLAVVDRGGARALPPLPEGSQWTPYLRRNFSGEYEPLLTSANTLPGSVYGKEVDETQVMGVAPDLSHLVLQGTGPGLQSGAVAGSLYEWSGGELQVASVLPASEGGADVEGLLGGASSRPNPSLSARHTVSNDGSRIVWERASFGEHDRGEPLYLRDMLRKETVRVSPGGGEFQAASSDGSRVFFTEDGELYVFEVTSGPDEALAGKVVDLTGNGSGVLGGILGASEDGSYVYFVAEGVLGDGAEHGAKPGTCENFGVPRESRVCNLYMEHYNGTEWVAPHFIAALSGDSSSFPNTGDGPDFYGGSPGHTLSEQPTRVSPNGRYLAFMSERSLTGYDNRDVRSGEPDEEVFLYDADANGGLGGLVCASCNPTGARPAGVLDEEFFPGLLVDYSHIWGSPGGSRWIAANIPGWTNATTTRAMYQSRYLSNNGRLFFNSADALVPADVDGTQDVYEYEPAGHGSCQAPGYGGSASDVFSEAAGGCVALISSGISGEESAFLDASEEGGDVFFMTSARLVGQDDDNAYDVYDAHECTSASPCLPAAALTPPVCSTGDACKPAPTPQPAIFGAPSSETFSGAGNITPSTSVPVAVTRSSLTRAQKLAKALKGCRKQPKRKRAGCESQARRRYGAKRSKAGRGSSVRAGR